jgi:hypothetical protein
MLLGVIAMRFEGKLEWDAAEDAVPQEQGSEPLPAADVPEGLGFCLMR